MRTALVKHKKCHARTFAPDGFQRRANRGILWPMRMTDDDLRPELRQHPEVKPVAVAFLELMAWRGRFIADMRESTGDRTLTLLDLDVLLYVFTFGLDGGGSRAQEIINSLGAPRRTVRDSLARWCRLGFLVQDGRQYHPAKPAAALYNAHFETRFRLIAKICDTFSTYRAAIGR